MIRVKFKCEIFRIERFLTIEQKAKSLEYPVKRIFYVDWLLSLVDERKEIPFNQYLCIRNVLC